MVQVTQGSIEWPLINETRWLCVDLGDKDKQESHRLMLHANLGIVFDSHGQCPAPSLATEAKMLATSGEHCACHLFALWLEKITPLDSIALTRDEFSPGVRVAEVTFGKTVQTCLKCEVRGQPADMVFFQHIAKQISPRTYVFWL